MISHVLQDFVTIRGSSSNLTITQSENGWLELDTCEDLLAWIDVRELTATTSVTFNLQTAPIKDEYLFVNMETTPLSLTAAQTAPKVRVITLAQLALASSPVAVPPGKFVRWQLVASATSTWDATFRIVVCANAVGSSQRGGGGMQAMRPSMG
jgi:hypothetical protein